ncbi:MAG: hypothetical protein QOI10_3983, partial [Solirubrobacterales bacterium]|nr:hypothetical protein [Solirubrobacterales bacterium]
MHFFPKLLGKPPSLKRLVLIAGLAMAAIAPRAAHAEALLVVEADTGKVLQA